MAVKTKGLTEGNLPEELKKLLSSVAANWGDAIDFKSLQVIHLSGAMTNEVYRISWPTTTDGVSRNVLLRLYGEGVDVFFNRDEEIQTFECLSNQGQGPRLLGQITEGWVVNTLLAGATVGSFTEGTLADKFARTKTFQLDAIPLTVGAILCATTHSVQTMILGRLLAGIGIGISSAIVPLYISEISPTEIRGRLGSVNQLFICVGILAALVAGLPLASNPQ